MNVQSSHIADQRPRSARHVAARKVPPNLAQSAGEGTLMLTLPHRAAAFHVPPPATEYQLMADSSGHLSLTRISLASCTRNSSGDLRLSISASAFSCGGNLLAAREAPRVRIQNSKDGGLSRKLRDLLAALQNSSPDDMAELDLAAQALVALCRRLIGQGEETVQKIQKGGLASWQTKRLEEFVRERIDGSLLIEELAQTCRLSASHFRRAFRRSMGTSPNLWVTNQRIAKAKELLRDVAQPIVDIALDCGFGDQSHFTRVFARVEGVPPGRWRRLIQQNIQERTG